MTKEKINVYLDDKRDCPNGFTIARNMEKAIELLTNYDVQILSLDHDLGEDENGKLLPTGYDFVKYFCLHNLFVEQIYIHTDNPPGRQAMYETLKGAQRRGFIAEDIKIHHYSITVNRYSGE
ncbi:MULTISPECIES: cyclic-phosphate processing receiver domain-containing protein [unclassified Bacillus (in: firmicutes)]|uniref:cyclic-phosphate processing receiver domain-containing protein n=1 Tax=unclassified Bacillus (in: firmicutes) TaxID=185979 RepID=UPI00300FC741